MGDVRGTETRESKAAVTLSLPLSLLVRIDAEVARRRDEVVPSRELTAAELSEHTAVTRQLGQAAADRWLVAARRPHGGKPPTRNSVVEALLVSALDSRESAKAPTKKKG